MKEEYCIGILRRVEVRDKESRDVEDPKVIGKILGKGTRRRAAAKSSWRQARKEDGDSGQVDGMGWPIL